MFWAALLKAHTGPPAVDLPAGCFAEARATDEEQSIPVGLQDHLVAAAAGTAEELLQPQHWRPAAARRTRFFDGDGTTKSLKGQSSHAGGMARVGPARFAAKTADLAAGSGQESDVRRTFV